MKPHMPMAAPVSRFTREKLNVQGSADVEARTRASQLGETCARVSGLIASIVASTSSRFIKTRVRRLVWMRIGVMAWRSAGNIKLQNQTSNLKLVFSI